MIQVPVVRGGDFAANALIYKPPSDNLINYLKGNMAHIWDKASQYTSQFCQTVQDMYNSLNSDDVILKSKLLLNQFGSHISQDAIYVVPYEHLNEANLMMQRYIMSQPDMNKLHKRNMCFGYAETYFEREPDTFGEERLDYQAVMDGVLQYDRNDGIGYTCHYSNMESDTPLSTIDQFSILDTWDNVVRALEEGKDPSDPLYEDL